MDRLARESVCMHGVRTVPTYHSMARSNFVALVEASSKLAGNWKLWQRRPRIANLIKLLMSSACSRIISIYGFSVKYSNPGEVNNCLRPDLPSNTINHTSAIQHSRLPQQCLEPKEQPSTESRQAKPGQMDLHSTRQHDDRRHSQGDHISGSPRRELGRRYSVR